MKKSLFAAALLSLALAACGGEKAAEAPASEAAKYAFSACKTAGYFVYPAFLISRTHLILFLNLHSFSQKHD